MPALFATVQLGVAFGADCRKIRTRGKLGGTIETARCRNRLHQPRQTGTGYIDGGARSLVRLLLGTVITVHVSPVLVFAIAIHYGLIAPELSAVWYMRATAVKVGMPDGIAGRPERRKARPDPTTYLPWIEFVCTHNRTAAAFSYLIGNLARNTTVQTFIFAEPEGIAINAR